MLVDDVLFSGRTIRAALDALNDVGRPARGPARRAGRPRPPRAADPRRLRRQEPPDLAGRAGPGPARRTSTTTTPSPSQGRRPRRSAMKRHLLSAGRPDPRRRRAGPRHRRGAAVAGRPADQEAAGAARPHRGQPVLRGLHPHPDLVRGRRQAALGRRHQLLRQGLVAVQGREPQGHRAHPRGDGRRRGRRPPRRQRRAAPAGQLRLGRGSSVVNAGDGTHEHPTQALLDAFTMWRHLGAQRRPRRPPGRDRRRRPAQPGGPLQRAAAAARSAPRSPWSRRRRCCRSASRAGRSRRRTTSTRCCPRPTR